MALPVVSALDAEVPQAQLSLVFQCTEIYSGPKQMTLSVVTLDKLSSLSQPTTCSLIHDDIPHPMHAK